MLGYYDAGYRLHRSAGLPRDDELAALKPRAGVRPRRATAAPASESRFAALYKTEPRDHRRARRCSSATTSPPTRARPAARSRRLRRAARRAATCSPTRRPRSSSARSPSTSTLQLPLRRLAARAREPAARRRCARRRGQQRRRAARTGVYLGAYGWLEDLRPAPRALRAGRARRPTCAAVFGAAEPPLVQRPAQRRLHPRAVAAPGAHRRGAAQRLPRQRDARQPRRAGGQPLLRARAARARRCSRASATARASARCSATASSAGCTTATGSPRSTSSSPAAQGVPAGRRPPGADADRPTCRSRRSRPATSSTAASS